MNFRACLCLTNDGDAEAEPGPVGPEKVKPVRSLLTLAARAKLLHRTGSDRDPEGLAQRINYKPHQFSRLG